MFQEISLDFTNFTFSKNSQKYTNVNLVKDVKNLKASFHRKFLSIKHFYDSNRALLLEKNLHGNSLLNHQRDLPAFNHMVNQKLKDQQH